MKNYQQFHYRTYYRMFPSGETVECDRQECFAPPEVPTADNPFIQRWYYSPDREIAIRLSRNAVGDETHKTNAADLKGQEREKKKPNLCIGQTSTATCMVTCQNCPNSKNCDSSHRANDGIKCKFKCDYCSMYTRRTFDLDKPISRTNDGDESGFDIEDDADGPVEILIKKETQIAILSAIDSLTPEERHLWNDLLSEKTKAKIAEECGRSEGAIRKRVKKLAETLRENPNLKNYF